MQPPPRPANDDELVQKMHELPAVIRVLILSTDPDKPDTIRPGTEEDARELRKWLGGK